MAGTGVRLARNTRLAILKKARELLSDPDRWTQKYLREQVDGTERYCLVGAIEWATYDLGYAEEQPGASFDLGDWNGNGALGYQLSSEISLSTFSDEKYGAPPWSVNDNGDYAIAMALLDSYIIEVEAGRVREPEAVE